jgi:putative DNA primase/helicase
VSESETVESFEGFGLEDEPAPPRIYRLTDGGNSDRLVDLHGPDLRYIHSWKQWFYWDSQRFQADTTGELMRRARDTILSMYESVRDQTDDQHRRALASWATRSDSEGMMRSMVSLAASDPRIATRPCDLDADPWRLTVENGTIDLRTGKLLVHSRRDRITKLAPVRFDAGATCPTWIDFLHCVLAGDGELLGFLQRAIGYSLTGDTSEQVLFFLCGSGANGKSTLLELLHTLLGDYAKQADFGTLLERRGDGPRNDVAALQGARLVTAIEASEGRRMDEGLVKQLTGGDTIVARRLYSEFFQFRPQFKLWLAANHRPVIRGTDHAIWRRIRLIPFTITISENQRDPELGRKLRAELPGILRWALEGCLAWQGGRLGNPPAVRDATAGYRTEMDVLAGFLEDCCELGEEHRAGATPLYQAYRCWCDSSVERAVSQKAFGQSLAERGYRRARGTGGRFGWFGLRLVNGVNGLSHSPITPPISAYAKSSMNNGSPRVTLITPDSNELFNNDSIPA